MVHVLDHEFTSDLVFCTLEKKKKLYEDNQHGKCLEKADRTIVELNIFVVY